MDIRTLRTEENLEKDGVWIALDGGEFRIASLNSTKYLRYQAAKSKAVGAAKLQADPKAAREVLIEVFSETILLDWRGEVKEGDIDLPPTKENKVRLLQIPAFRDWVSMQASTLRNFQAEGDAADVDALKSKD